ncbi:MAG: hypothetical protein RLZZ272_361 [Actinomycetota bacterium]|jgi:cysteine desulfurase
MVEPDAHGSGLDALEVDALGLPCPRPVIELARAVDRTDVGGLVVLHADDPAVGVDVPVWVRLKRHRMVEQRREGAAWRFVVERRH